MLTFAAVGVVDASLGVAPKVRLALLAVQALGVVLTVVADAAGGLARLGVDGLVKVTGTRVVVALTHLALVGGAASRWLPGPRF